MTMEVNSWKKKAKPQGESSRSERPRDRADGPVVSELKAGLSAYLARVKRGEEIVVTERGEPIARIVPSVAPRAMNGIGSVAARA